MIYSDDSWTIYQVTSYVSACTLGKGTSWYTASQDDQYSILSELFADACTDARLLYPYINYKGLGTEAREDQEG